MIKNMLFLSAVLIIASITASNAVTTCYRGFFRSDSPSSSKIEIRNCSSDLNKSIFCVKQIYTGNGKTLIDKDCSDDCEEKSFSGDGVEVKQTCCTKDNCNKSSTILSNKLLATVGVLCAFWLSVSF